MLREFLREVLEVDLVLEQLVQVVEVLVMAEQEDIVQVLTMEIPMEMCSILLT